MINRINEYLEYLYVTGELDRITLCELINRYNMIYGELPESFFKLDEEEQVKLLESSLKCKSKIIKL